MKIKLLFTAVLSVLLFSVSQAQSFHAGIMAGANLNKIDGQSFKNEFDFGYHAGAFVEIGLGKKFSIEPQVLFSQTSTDTTTNFSTVYNTNNLSNVTLNYLSIPLLANYKLSKLLSIQLGPQYGILLNSNENLTQNGKDAFKQGDFSMLGGLQLNILSFRVYGRYAIGLSNLNDIDNQNQWKSETIQIGVGYSIL
jgi:outer membrane protein with beta-barrel domain